ncbi:hypothetical protein D1AOALGA4SA_1465 [Olavius algarvensis Delta 1 endosymbiont]|nr:hypothetical protein D1AOALGA4SA_1465 [Olavius algarvensis Delta 1 endosymbiont]
MNVQHRTSNNVFCLFRKTERSESDIRHSSLVIRHSLKFHTSAASG